jgi:hypothetical protein
VTERPAALRALGRKYRTLASWRRARDAEAGGGGGVADRGALRELAAEFPGALRELDVLGIGEIERRVRVLEGTVGWDGDGDKEEWIEWIWAYHRLMRVALAVRRIAGKGAVTAKNASELATRISAEEGIAVEAELVVMMARPPGGRLAVVVLRELGRRFDVPAARIAATLFPPRRASPYAL